MKQLTIIVVFLLLGHTTYTQPSWVITPSDFAYNMSVFGISTGACSTLGDMVAALDQDDNIRGVSDVNTVDQTFFMIVYSNLTAGETLHFAYYDSESDEVFELTAQTFQFVQGGFLGSPTPFLISSPETVKPVASCKAVTIYLDEDGLARLSVSQVDDGSTDNCDSIALAIGQELYDCSHLGTNEVTLVVTDASGNQDTCTSIVTVLDTIKPVAICRNISLYLNSDGIANATAEDVDSTSADNCSVAALSLSQATFGCDDLGANTIYLIATDASGNQDSCMAVITIIDTIYPQVMCRDTTIYLDAAGLATLTPASVYEVIVENCTISDVYLDTTHFDCNDLGDNPVVLTVTDQSGHTTTCMTTVTVMDTLSPVVVCQSKTLYLDVNGIATLSATDLDNGITDNCEHLSFAVSQTNFICTDLGGTDIILTVTDESGNQTTCVSQVTVLDTIPPDAICKNITITLGPEGTSTISPADINNDSYDNCGQISLALSKTSFHKNETPVQSIWLIATDGSIHRDSCLSTITIINPYENSIAKCTDGMDNDNDGLTDCNDLDCGPPAITGIDITTPTSSDCNMSNDDGLIQIHHLGADAFSIDGGNSFGSEEVIGGLTSGVYPAVAMNSGTGCYDEAMVELLNVHVPILITEDVVLNCINYRETMLLSSVVNGTSPYDFSWEDSSGQSYPDSALVQEGTYRVTVSDASACSDTAIMMITLAPDPLIGVPPPDIMGPQTICAGMLEVGYSIEADTSIGNLIWGYDGGGVSFFTHDGGLKANVNYSETTEEGLLTVVYGNLCSELRDTLPISLGSESICSFAHCPNQVFINTELLQSAGAPDIYRAASTLSSDAQITDRSYYFSAGEELSFDNGFSVAAGHSLVATIKSCGQ